MIRMFLSSSFSDSSYLLREFLGTELENKTVTFIPTAGKVEEITHYVDSARESFKNLGMKIFELDISERSYEEIEMIIKGNDMIYVSGGNTFFLLQEIKSKKIDKIIMEEIRKGKPYIGESAGSIIMAPDIEYISLLDDKEKAQNLSSYKGLEMIDKYPLPHLQNKYLGKHVEQIIKVYENKIDLLPITDHQAILVTNDRCRVI